MASDEPVQLKEQKMPVDLWTHNGGTFALVIVTLVCVKDCLLTGVGITVHHIIQYFQDTEILRYLISK